MALDHYVSQVHLKNFYAQELGELMYAIRKQDQKLFTPDAQSVCRIEEGSTNKYLRDQRAIEEFLKGIEPKYNSAVKKFLDDQIDAESVYVISGFMSYVLTCSPAAMRIHSAPFRGAVEETARQLDRYGELPSPPPELAGDSLSGLLEKGKIRIKVDEKYPQAHGIASVLHHTTTFGNSAWEVLVNPFEDNPFFTSDYPVAIEHSHDRMVFGRIVPLTPHLAVRVVPDKNTQKDEPEFGFSGFRYKRRRMKRADVKGINRALVRCAESLVFYSRMDNWVPRFVEKNANFRVKPRTRRIPKGVRTLLWFTQEVVDLRQ